MVHEKEDTMPEEEVISPEESERLRDEADKDPNNQPPDWVVAEAKRLFHSMKKDQ